MSATGKNDLVKYRVRMGEMDLGTIWAKRDSDADIRRAFQWEYGYHLDDGYTVIELDFVSGKGDTAPWNVKEKM
jgi:hypothetical protein